MLYEILTVADAIPRTVSPRVVKTVPCTRAIGRFTQCERKTKCLIEGEWEYSAGSGHMNKKEVIK